MSYRMEIKEFKFEEFYSLVTGSQIQPNDALMGIQGQNNLLIVLWVRLFYRKIDCKNNVSRGNALYYFGWIYGMMLTEVKKEDGYEKVVSKTHIH